MQPAELSTDCKVVVKIRDEDMWEALCRSSPEQLNQQANQAQLEAAKKNQILPIAGHPFLATRYLPSRDVLLYTSSANIAEVLRKHAYAWIGVFGRQAYIRTPT